MKRPAAWLAEGKLDECELDEYEARELGEYEAGECELNAKLDANSMQPRCLEAM